MMEKFPDTEPLTIYQLENDYTYHINDYDRKRIIDKLRHKSRGAQESIIDDLMDQGIITENLKEDD